METNTRDFLESLLTSLESIGNIRVEDIPNIDLYMDQVTTFMDNHLNTCKRREDDKVLTKTMINNYAKNNLLPPPHKKKYSREHVIVLTFIYYLKGLLSINDIQTILNPITEKFFQNEDSLNIQDIYQEVYDLEKVETKNILKDLYKKYNIAKESFSEYKEEDQDFLQTFMFICLLSYDVYLKKTLIERLVDQLTPKNEEKEGDNTQEES